MINRRKLLRKTAYRCSDACKLACVHEVATDHISVQSIMHRMPDRHGDRNHGPDQSFVAEYPDGHRKRTRPTSASASSPLGKSREGSSKSHVLIVFSSLLLQLPRRTPQTAAQLSSRCYGASGLWKLLGPE